MKSELDTLDSQYVKLAGFSKSYPTPLQIILIEEITNREAHADRYTVSVGPWTMATPKQGPDNKSISLSLSLTTLQKAFNQFRPLFSRHTAMYPSLDYFVLAWLDLLLLYYEESKHNHLLR